MRAHSKAFLLSLLLTAVLFFFTLLFPSLLNGHHPSLTSPIDNSFLQEIWQLHSTHPAFAGRPLTNFSLAFLHFHLGIPFGIGFALVNFSLLFFSALLIYSIAREYKLSEAASLFSVAVFFLSFTILFAFLRSIDTYDDPWQYFFLLSTLYFLLKERWTLAVPLFFLACIARETSLFLIPGLAIIACPSQEPFQWKNFLKSLLLLAIPALAYLAVEPLILQHYHVLEASKLYAAQTRFEHWHFNFQNPQFTIETIFSFFLTLAFPTLLVLGYRAKNVFTIIDKKILIATIITIIINTPTVLIAARAREARLFALPLLILWPHLGKYALSWFAELKAAFSAPPATLFLRCTLFILSLATIAWLSFAVYRPTFSAGADTVFQAYCFLTLALIIGYIFFTLPRRNSKQSA